MKYGAKWNKNHKCPNQIPLHILEEILEVMNIEDMDGEEPEQEDESSEEEILALSLAAIEGITDRRIMKLQGLIGS